jgi:hypothetical protein
VLTMRTDARCFVSTSGGKRMMRMVWPALDAAVDVDMHWDVAPTLCGLIWEQMPFRSVQEHALITGCMLLKVG